MQQPFHANQVNLTILKFGKLKAYVTLKKRKVYDIEI